MRRRHFETLVVSPTPRHRGFQKSPDFRREHVVGPWTSGERRPETPLGEAQPVVRSGVEVPNAEIPRRINRRGSLLIAHRPIEIPELSATQRKLTQPQRAADGLRRDRRRRLDSRSWSQRSTTSLLRSKHVASSVILCPGMEEDHPPSTPARAYCRSTGIGHGSVAASRGARPASSGHHTFSVAQTPCPVPARTAAQRCLAKRTCPGLALPGRRGLQPGSVGGFAL